MESVRLAQRLRCIVGLKSLEGRAVIISHQVGVVWTVEMWSNLRSRHE